MYLVDRDIRLLLHQMHIETDHVVYPFSAEQQIQPCSIDLRLSNVFWKPRRGVIIDLRRARLMELAPRRYWKRIVLKPHETISIHPSSMILGRIYEKLNMPSDHAGKIEGRSSFSRLGLAVHCTGDFINPGYRGHMPLQLINSSSQTIKLIPYLPICQLKIIKLSGKPDHVYGERELQSKYVDDDGGPSYWWRDGRIEEIQRALGEFQVASELQQQILERIGVQELEVLDRFSNFIGKLPARKLENVDTVLDSFAKSEELARFVRRLKKTLLTGAFPLFAGVALGSLLAPPFGVWHYLIWVAGILSAPLSVYGILLPLGEYLGEKELVRLRTKYE